MTARNSNSALTVVTSRPSGRPGLRSLGASFAALVFLLLSLPAVAQFSGPTVGTDAQLNLPLKPTTDPAILYPGPRDLTIERGDTLAVHIFSAGTDNYGPTVPVSLDGTVRLPLIGLVQVSGLTIHQAESLIASKLVADGMYVNPQVTVQVTESPNDVATVTGESHGVVPILGSKHLYEVLSAAGGLPVTASHIITINRPGLDQPIVVDLGTDPSHSARADVPIFAHDTVVVSRVGVVYMLGEFRTSGQIALQKNSPLTLMQAVSLSGGTIHEGKFNDLRIIRTTGNSRSVIRVDIKKIMYGKAPDPVLQADDVVFLPTDPIKVATTLGGIGTVIGIVSILVYTFHP